MKQVFLTLKFFEAIDYLPTKEDVLDFFVTKGLDKKYKREDLNKIISDLIIAKEIILFEDLYLGLPDLNFEIRKSKQLERIAVSKLILRKIKKHNRIFSFIDTLSFFGLYGMSSETNVLILEDKLSPLYRFILKLIKIKDPLIIYTSDLVFKSHDIKSAFYLLKMPHVYSKLGVYEKFIFKNPWIFDYFGNYPVDKVSLSYKVVF